MEEHLRALLTENNNVILPGFGVIMVNRSSGRTSFNSFVKYNDGLLVGHITEQEGCSEKEALDKVNTYIQEIHEKVEKNGQFEIEGVGTFYKTDSGKLTLEGKKMDISPQKGSKDQGISAKKSDRSGEKAQGPSPAPEKSSSSSGAQTEQKKAEQKAPKNEEKEEKGQEKGEEGTEKDKSTGKKRQKEKVERKDEKKTEKSQKEKEGNKKNEQKAEKKKEKEEKKKAKKDEKEQEKEEKKREKKAEKKKEKSSSQADRSGEKTTSEQKKKSRGRIAPLLLILLSIGLIGGGGTGLWFGGWYEGPPFNWLGLVEEGEAEKEKEKDAGGEKPEKGKEANGKGNKKADPDSSGAKAASGQKTREAGAKSDGAGSKSGDQARSNKQGGGKKAASDQGSKPASSPEGNYHIIAGCFKYEQLADTLVKDLKKEGYNARKVGKTSGLTAVSANSYASPDQAKKALEDFKGRQSDAWILKR